MYGPYGAGAPECATCAKWTLIVCSVLIAIGGLAYAVAAGGRTTEEHKDRELYIGWTVVGLVGFVQGVLGTVGAGCEILCCLWGFIVITLIQCLISLGYGIYVMSTPHDMNTMGFAIGAFVNFALACLLLWASCTLVRAINTRNRLLYGAR